MSKIFGIDLGGTKIEGVVLDPSNIKSPVIRIRRDTESHFGYERIIQNIGAIVLEMQEKVNAKPNVVGIGIPGTLDPKSGVVKNANTTCMNGRPMNVDLERELKCPVVLANDANCFALAEYSMGAGQGAKVCFGVIMGTGVGGGIVVNGAVVGGAQGIAGEWGHNILIEDGELCYCGKRGCIESVISGPALERYYLQNAGKRVGLSEIYSRYKDRSDKFAELTINRLVQNFGRAISIVINILDPDIVVLGGGVSNIEVLYTEGVEEAKKYVFNKCLDTKIVRNELGDSAGVFGAGMLVS